MDDLESVVLSEQLVKNLLDKTQEKREFGGRQLQTIMASIKNEDQIKRIARYFREKFITQPSYQQKKAGLHAIYSIALEICKNEPRSKACLDDIIMPMLDCFNDKEERVRYAGIEYMFLTCRCMNDIVLIQFNAIYKKLIKNILDTDESVKKAAQQLDNCLKSLVTSTAPEKQYFKIAEFIKTISTEINRSNPQVKCNLISWISTLNSIPYVELFDYISMFLKELFLILADNTPYASDAKIQAKRQLDEFQKDIERYSHRQTFNSQQEIKTHRQIIDILLKVSSECNNDSNVLSQVLNWLQEYLRIVIADIDQSQAPQSLELSGGQIIRGINLISHSVFDEQKECILQQIIMENLNGILKQVLGLLSHENPMINQQAQNVNEQLLQIMDKQKESNKEFVDIMPTIQDMLKEKNSGTAEKALIWMRHLVKTQTEKLKPMIENILDNLIDRLKDAETQVVQNVMEVLASMSNEQYFDMVIEKILNIFHKNRNVLTKKSELILKKLCVIWNPEIVYTTICTKLLQNYVYVDEELIDLDFASHLVQSLEYLLITNHNLMNVRSKLKNFKYEKNELTAKKTHDFFQKIYRTFCFNPVSALTLSFLAEEYELTYNIILILAETEADIETLVQIAKLIILLESPVFAYLRLQLLEASRYPYLLQSLEGLMMILPQTPIQNQLKQRLKNVDIFYDCGSISQQREVINQLDTQMLLKIFTGIRKEEQYLRKLSEESD